MARMQPHFRFDLRQVRVHDDTVADASAQALAARAYARGRDIYFARGEYRPGTTRGDRLLAHELAHIEDAGEASREVQRAPNSADAALKKATALETEVLGHPVYKALDATAKARVAEIIASAALEPLSEAKGGRLYYLAKLLVAIKTPYKGVSTGSGSYGCSPDTEKRNQEQVTKAIDEEKKTWEGSGFENVEERILDSAQHLTQRTGRQGKTFLVDRSDPRRVRVRIKVLLKGKPSEVGQIRRLEDAIERASHTQGYTLDVVFVDKPGSDVFEMNVRFCEWPNAGNWASGPVALSHEVHHALGLRDRYDYIEAHAANEQMNVEMRLHWFREQMKKVTGPRDPFSKMASSKKTLLAEDVCGVAFDPGADRTACIAARKDLDPSGVPPL